jgi:hypothetical protein
VHTGPTHIHAEPPVIDTDSLILSPTAKEPVREEMTAAPGVKVFQTGYFGKSISASQTSSGMALIVALANTLKVPAFVEAAEMLGVDKISFPVRGILAVLEQGPTAARSPAALQHVGLCR